ncbi:hypothetical protein B0H13DRAFT_1853979 [Mycena leptocephala]|nr:hypothetical protein B0H13DRAFT_1853979 [Mycena leptocephala]
MPPKLAATQTRLKNITTCLTVTANTLEILVDNLHISFLAAISNTTQSLLKCIQAVKQNKSDCADLMEKTHTLLNAIIIVYIKSDTGTNLPPIVLKHIGSFTETLHKIHTFVEVQQDSSRIHKIFRRGEINALLNDCIIRDVNIMTDISEMQENARKRHEEVLNLVETISDVTSSDGASSISRVYSGYHNSSNSISMLPSEPKIFHGRESELSDILTLCSLKAPRIALLGAGGMGKTSLARAVLHHTKITAKYEQHRFFVACDSATTKVELTALIGAHLGLKPGKDLTQSVIQHFSMSPPSLLILDNLETSWEPNKSRNQIEEFLSFLTGIDHLSLIITLRGAERPAKVAWTRPFLPPLKPLEQGPAYQTFVDIADDQHSPEEVDKVLTLTDNMPLAISLLAHLVDSEGCAAVLSRWEKEKTSMVSEGFDKRSNLDLSISLSLSSPRFTSLPHSQELLSLLSILPDGLSDAELVQSRLPINNILACKAALICTSLAYTNEQKQLKALVPIREYVQKVQPPGDHLVRPLLKHFRELLEFIVTRISSNLSNIQNVLQSRLQPDQIGPRETIYCICDMNQFNRRNGQGSIPLIAHVHNMLPHLHDPHLEVYCITELLASSQHHSISNHNTLISDYIKKIEQVHDTDLKCRFYICIANYYKLHGQDLSSAISFLHMAISLADSTGNNRRHSQALHILARLKQFVGDYSASQLYAHESQRMARISAQPYREANALVDGAICLYTLGDYKQSISLFNKARNLLGLCGASGGQIDHEIMIHQAEVHKLKSEYVEAQNIHSELLREVSITQDLYHQAATLLNSAEIAVVISGATQIVQRDIQTARQIFNTRQLHMEVMMCETILADLYLREGNVLAAESLLKKCAKSSSIRDPQIISYCLERLGDVCRWKVPYASSWTTVYLVHSLKFKENLGIHKALQFLGDIFHSHNDEESAVSLYTVALEGFTQMDVHRSRAECMLHLGDISKGHGDLLRALELWETARPLFERSSQAKQVENIDERLASVGDDVLEQHRKNLASLAEPNAPSGAVEDPEDEVSDIENLEVDLNKAKNIQLVVA